MAPSNFESTLCIALFRGEKKKLFSAKLGFDDGSVIVEALEGIAPPDERSPDAKLVTKWVTGKHGSIRQFDVPTNKYLEEFRGLASNPAPNFLLKEIEQVAKQSGYKEVRIRRPETLFWYRYYLSKPAYSDELRRMGKMYYAVAAKEHYRKSGAFLLKKI